MGKIFESRPFCIFFAFVCILFFSKNGFAQVGIEKKGLTKITGQIKNPISKSIGVKFYKDIISRDEEVFDIPLSDKNTFSISFQLNAATPAFLIYNNEEVPIYLEQEDELYVNCKGVDFAKTITFAGKGAGKSRYLKNINEVFPERNSDYIFYELVERDAMDFRRYMDRLYRKMWGFYHSLPPELKKDFTPDFEHYIKADIEYWYAYNLLRYRVENPLSNGIYEPIELPKSYYSFLDNLLISNEKALTNRNYLYFIDQYISFRNHLFDSQSELPFKAQSVVVTAPSMLVFKEPNSPPILEEATEGTALKFLGEKTDYTSDIQIKEELKKDNWFKVKSTTGEVGWIHGAGIQEGMLADKTVQEKFPFEADAKNRNIFELFSGKTLYYLLANELYWSANRYLPSNEDKSIEDFIQLNPYMQFDSILLYASKGVNEVPATAKTFIHYVQEMNIDYFDNPLGKSNEKITTVAVQPTPSKTTTTTPPIPSTTKKKNIQARLYKTVPQKEYVYIDPKPAARETTLSSISGKIDTPTGAKLRLVLYANPITLDEIMHELDLKPNGTFELALNLAQPTIGVLEYGKHKIDIYLEPGDLMQVKFSGTDVMNSLQFAGRGNPHNNYLKDYKIRFSNIDKEARAKAEKMQAADYKTYLENIKSEKINFLNSSRYINDFSFAFRKYTHADIKYWYGYLMLNYPWEYGIANNLDGAAPMPKSYYDFLNGIPCSMEGALPNNNYTYFLDNFFDYQSEHPDNQGLSTYQLIDKFLVGEPAAYFKAKKMAIACKRGKAAQEGEKIKSFIENNPYEIYNDVLRLGYNEAKGLQIGLDAPDFTLADASGNEVALSDFKGKVVYLDFWATWCSPCLHQMKNSKIWKSEFADKDVVFVYVSLDKNKTAWEKFQKNNTIEGVHLIATGGDVYKSQIAKLYKVKKLPAYFLIDKQGKIAFKPERGKNITRVQEKIQALLYDGR